MPSPPRHGVAYVRQYRSAARTKSEMQEIVALQVYEIDEFASRNGYVIDQSFRERPVDRRSKADRRVKLREAIRRCRELGPSCVLVYVDFGERYADDALRAALNIEVENANSPLIVEVVRNPSQRLLDLLSQRRDADGDISRRKTKAERNRRTKIAVGVKSAVDEGRLDTGKAREAASKSRKNAADDKALSASTKMAFIDTSAVSAKIERFCRAWNKQKWGLDENYQPSPSGRPIRMTPRRLTWLMLKLSELEEPGSAAMLRSRGIGESDMSLGEMAKYLNKIKLPQPSGKTGGWTKTGVSRVKKKGEVITDKSTAPAKT